MVVRAAVQQGGWVPEHVRTTMSSLPRTTIELLAGRGFGYGNSI